MCMKVLNLLIIDQQEVLRDEIAKLDNFPVHEMFNELKNVHHTVKYKGKQFSLVEEVEHFLSMDKRKIEGLISLRENVRNLRIEFCELFLKCLYLLAFQQKG